MATKLHSTLIFTFFFVLLHFANSWGNRHKYKRGNYPIISHLRPDTQNSHLAFVSWSFDRSPLAYDRFELYNCIHNISHEESHSIPNTELLAEVPNTQMEAMIKNMPETNTPCIIVCAVIKVHFVSCSKKFACVNTKYTIPTGSMRLVHPNIAPILVKAKREFNKIRISWNYPFPNIKNSFFLIDINFASDRSFGTIDRMLHMTEVVQIMDLNAKIRLDASQIETEKFAFIKVCSMERVNHRERKNCSDPLVIPLSEVEEDLEEDMAVEITGVRTHLHSASIILGEELEHRNTSELSVVCLADHRSERTNARVLEWRTSNMRGNILNLEGLHPATHYKCSIQAKPSTNSIAYTIYAKNEFIFRTKTMKIENPSPPLISGSQYTLEGNTIINPFSIQLQPTEPQAEINSYLLVAWPQHTSLPTQFDSHSVNTLANASDSREAVPFTQEVLSPDMLPIEYMFDFVVNKKAYKQNECYYFLLAAVPFATNSTYPFSASNACVAFSYTEGKISGMSGMMKKIGLVSVVLITVGFLVSVLVIMVFVAWKLRLLLSQQKHPKDDEKDGLDLVFDIWDKVRGRRQNGDDTREVFISKANNSGFLADTEISDHEIGPIINQEYTEFSSD